jgi:hypothetical protein
MINIRNLRLKILQAYKFVVRDKITLSDLFLNMLFCFYLVRFKELKGISFFKQFYLFTLLSPILSELFFSYLFKKIFNEKYWNLFSCLCYCSWRINWNFNSLSDPAVMLFFVLNFLSRNYRNFIYEKFDNFFIPIFLQYFSELMFILICFFRFYVLKI